MTDPTLIAEAIATLVKAAKTGDDKAIEKEVRHVAMRISCFEQGAAAELRRLKEFLGDSLPDDWEARRFDRLNHEQR